MAGTITTTTEARALEWPGQSLMDRKSKDGDTGASYMVTLTGTTLNVWRQAASVGGWVTQNISLARSGIVELGGFFIDPFNYGHVVYRVNESSKDRVFYRRINLESTPNVWGAETLVVESANGGVAGSALHGSDIVAMAIGTSCVAVIATGLTGGGLTGVQLNAFKIATGSAFPSTTTNVTSTVFAGYRMWRWSGSGYLTPSLDISNTGNGHYAPVPHIWVTIGRTRSQFAKLVYGSGKWTGPSALSTFAGSGVVAQDYSNCRWDGQRLLSTTVLSASPDAVTVHERDSANTKTIIRTTPAHPQGNIRARAINYEYVSKDVRVYAVGTTTGQLYFVDYNRAAGTWGTWSQFSATALQDVQSWGVRRGSAGRSRFDVYWEPASASPYTLTHVEQALSFAPYTPTWVTPASGQAADVGDPLTLSWTFSDPDPGGTPGGYALSRQIGAGTVNYWNASNSTWSVTEIQNAGSATSVTLPAGWGADADLSHTYKVKVWDNDNTPSGYSAPALVTPSTNSTTTITAPTAGAVVTDDLVTVSWSHPAQVGYNVRLMKAFDLFGRVTASGWGTSDSGSVWTSSGGSASDYSTNGTEALVSLGTVNVVRYMAADAASAADDVAVMLRCPVTPTGADIVASVMLFYVDTSNHHRADVLFKVGGTVQLQIVKVSGGVTTVLAGPTQVYATHDVNRWYGLRFTREVTWSGSRSTRDSTERLAAKLWDTLEPTYYHARTGVQTDLGTAGRIGVRAVANTSNTNTLPVLVRFDTIRRPAADRVYDSGWVTSAETSVDVPYSLGDLTEWVADVAVMNTERLVQRTATTSFTVDYVEPPTPTLTVTALPGIGALRVTVNNPTPTGLQPALAYNDIFRKANGEGDEQAVRFVTDGAEDVVWDDHQAVSGVDYLYQVRAFGVNGTRVDSVWT